MYIRKLQKAIENAEVKQKMDMEDSLLDELTEMERLIDNLGEENVQKIHKIEELESEKKQVESEKKQVESEKKQVEKENEELKNELAALRKLLEDKGK